MENIDLEREENPEKGSDEWNTKEFNKLMDEGRIEFVTFHPSFCYEDFVEGIKPSTDDNGNIKYNVVDGVFKRICKQADENEDKKFVLIIDEINRGNIPKIFGELITLIEPDKRKNQSNELSVTLPYSKKRFTVPSNLYILGTMNTADSSIALIDIALRRRFSFIELMPDYPILMKKHNFSGWGEVKDKASKSDPIALSIQALEKINEKIKANERLGRDKQIGHSYLWNVDDVRSVLNAWRYDILPLLQEYLYGRFEEMAEILNDRKTLIDLEEQKINDFSESQLIEGLKKVISEE